MTNTKSEHIGYCPVTTKAQYKNKKSAKRSVRRYCGNQTAYRCDEVCGYWHVGNPPTPGESRERMRQWRKLGAEGYHGWSNSSEGTP